MTTKTVSTQTTRELLQAYCTKYNASFETCLKRITTADQRRALDLPCIAEQLLTEDSNERFDFVDGAIVRCGNALKASHVIGVSSYKDVRTQETRYTVLFMTRIQAAKRRPTTMTGQTAARGQAVNNTGGYAVHQVASRIGWDK